jgi:membrane associated rhomboid family serine protease
MLYQSRSFSFGGGNVTPAVKFLLIVNTAVFILQIFLDQYLTWLFGLVPHLVWQNLYLWQLFTYQFLHGGLFHLLFNMLALWMFGCALERRWERVFLKYYFISVIGGGILIHCSFRSNGAEHRASAGVYGILLAFGLIYPNQIVYLLSRSAQNETFCLDHRRHRPLFLHHLRRERHRPLAHLGGMLFGYLYLAAAIPGTGSELS